MRPDIDIVMLCYNRSDLTLPAILNLYRRTKDVRYRLWVIDNGSTDHTPRMLRWLKANTRWWLPWAKYRGLDLRLRREDQNRGFAKGCNIGARLGDAPWILFINNDAFPTSDNWLSALRTIAEGRQWDAIGPISNAVIGIQWDKWNGRWPDVHESKFLSGFCLLIRRKMFERVKGFDEWFFNGDEDLDLSIRIRQEGGKCGVCRKVFVKHLNGQTLHALAATQGLTLQDWYARTREQLIWKHGLAWHRDLFWWQQFRIPQSRWARIGVAKNGRYIGFKGDRPTQAQSFTRFLGRLGGTFRDQLERNQPGLFSRYGIDAVGDTWFTRCRAN